MAKLSVTVANNSQNIESTIIIRAPLERVFAAHTDADLFSKWWVRGNPMKIHSFNAVAGGTWHIAEIADDGEFEFFGTFHEVCMNTRIIQTFEFLGMDERGHVALDRTDFLAVDPKTTQISICSTYQSVEDLRGMVESGMEDGFRQSVYALGRLLGDVREE